MVQNSSYLIPADNCGVWWVSVFHVYKGSFNKVGYVGDFVKVSVNLTSPQNWLQNNTNLKGILISTNNENINIDGSHLKFTCNNVILLNNSTTPMGKEIYGPTINDLNSNKFINSFPGII